VGQSRAGWYYPPKENNDAPLLRRMEEIAATRVRYGFWRIYVLLRREGWQVNHKRVYRLHRQAGLNLRRKRPRRRKAAAHRLERVVLAAPNQCWSMDFVADALFDGRRFRALTVVDNFTKESLAIEVDGQLKGEDVVTVEPPRISRRLQLLRGWSHEQVSEVLTGSAGARGSDGAGAPARTRITMGSDQVDCRQDRLYGRDAA
jgi:putative transposase